MVPDELTARRWGADPRFAADVRRWGWFRESVPLLLQGAARDTGIAPVPPVDMQALARSFWNWAASLDRNAPLEPLDAVDFAHFEVGMLVSLWVAQRPLRLPDTQRSDEIRVLTETGLTLLTAWRLALGAEPAADGTQAYSAERWSSYVENVVEDPSVAVAFIDQFTGREPVWRFPTLPAERPPLRRALQSRRQTG